MKNLICILTVVGVVALFAASGMAAKTEKVLFSFENDAEGWEIPEWALEKQDNVSKNIEASRDFAKDGKAGLKIQTDFPGKIWAGAIVEVAESYDFAPYGEISCDIYLPKEAPAGLKGKIILTVGENWKFTEMSRSVSLVPGKWTTISADLLPGSMAWARTVVDENFRKDVRKIAVRVESNKNPTYSGPIYIDNLKVIGR